VSLPDETGDLNPNASYKPDIAIAMPCFYIVVLYDLFILLRVWPTVSPAWTVIFLLQRLKANRGLSLVIAGFKRVLRWCNNFVTVYEQIIHFLSCC
jgi:hypothetical protein